MHELLASRASAATLATAPGECGRKMLLLLVLPCRPTSFSMSAPHEGKSQLRVALDMLALHYSASKGSRHSCRRLLHSYHSV